MPADVEGFSAGDLLTAIEGVPTPDLDTFAAVAYHTRDRQRVDIQLTRGNRQLSLPLSALQGVLGTANGETAPMIPPGQLPPHGYLGPCTTCHHIGSSGNLAVDLGDALTKGAPPIRAGQQPPHRRRGACPACHVIR